jgi:hypothetical protein
LFGRHGGRGLNRGFCGNDRGRLSLDNFDRSGGNRRGLDNRRLGSTGGPAPDQAGADALFIHRDIGSDRRRRLGALKFAQIGILEDTGVAFHHDSGAFKLLDQFLVLDTHLLCQLVNTYLSHQLSPAYSAEITWYLCHSVMNVSASGPLSRAATLRSPRPSN